MTNAQVKTTLFKTPQLIAPKKSEKSNPGSLNNLGTWNPGTSARAVIALLKLTSILCKISNDYGDQVQAQIQASNTIAKATGQAQVNQGDADYSEALAQGIGGIVGGSLSTLGAVGTMNFKFNNDELEGLENEEQGLKTYSENLESKDSIGGITEENAESPVGGLEEHLKAIEEVPSEKLREMGTKKKTFLKENPKSTKEEIAAKNEELLGEIKSQEESEYTSDAEAIKQANQTEVTKLKKAIDERLKTVRDQKSSLMSDSNNKMQGVNTILQGAQQAISSIGAASGASFKKESAQYQKDQTLDRNASDLINGILNSNRNDETQYFEKSNDVNQVINAIRQANQIN